MMPSIIDVWVLIESFVIHVPTIVGKSYPSALYNFWWTDKFRREGIIIDDVTVTIYNQPGCICLVIIVCTRAF